MIIVAAWKISMDHPWKPPRQIQCRMVVGRSGRVWAFPIREGIPQILCFNKYEYGTSVFGTEFMAMAARLERLKSKRKEYRSSGIHLFAQRCTVEINKVKGNK